MAKCEMNIEFEGAANAQVEKARTAITGAKGMFEGDDNSGEFSIPVFGSQIEGNYTISNNQFQIFITDKPLLIGCKRIEEELREYLSQENSATS